MADLFPEMTYDRIDEWMGHRPATADSLPVIGASPNAANIFLGYGHPINTDLSAYAADRRI